MVHAGTPWVRGHVTVCPRGWSVMGSELIGFAFVLWYVESGYGGVPFCSPTGGHLIQFNEIKVNLTAIRQRLFDALRTLGLRPRTPGKQGPHRTPPLTTGVRPWHSSGGAGSQWERPPCAQATTERAKCGLCALRLA